MNLFKDMLISVDVLSGKYISVRQPAYILEDILEGDGIYSQDEWALARSKGYRDAGMGSADLDSNAKYLTRMLSVNSRNTLAALRLCQSFDFDHYGSVLELGCGEMIQAFVIKSAYPHLRVMATDFDAYVIGKCAQLDLLGGVEKEVLDVAAIAPEMLEGFGVVMSWDMNYALNDDILLKVLRAAKAANIPYLACSTQHIGVLRYLFRGLKGVVSRNSVDTNKQRDDVILRMHGWQTSVGYYQKLAKRAGMHLTSVTVPPVGRSRKDDFVYVLVSP